MLTGCIIGPGFTDLIRVWIFSKLPLSVLSSSIFFFFSPFNFFYLFFFFFMIKFIFLIY
jgi:hypothetical protein